MANVLLESLVVFVQLVWIFLSSVVGFFLPQNRKDITGKVILITGSANGIGKEMAIVFNKLGAKLALLDIDQKSNTDLVHSLREHGQVIGYRCDLTSEADIGQVARTILKDFGQVDILINNAGYVRCAPLLQLTSSDIKRTFEVNTMAHFWLIQQLLPSMIERKSGHIVAISSVAGLIGTTNLVDYCASKFAVTGMMDALYWELHDLGHSYIRLTTICPLSIATGMFRKLKTRFDRLLPIMSAEYTAEQVVAAIVEERTLLTIPRKMFPLLQLARLIPLEAVSLLRTFLPYGVDKHDA